MARVSRNRAKNMPKIKIDIDLNSPSNVLYNLLESLNLKFDHDMGMLTGHHVKNMPDRKSLMELKENLKNLHELIVKNIDIDNEKIENIRHLKEVSERNEITEDAQIESELQRQKEFELNTEKKEENKGESSKLEDKTSNDEKLDKISDNKSTQSELSHNDSESVNEEEKNQANDSNSNVKTDKNDETDISSDSKIDKNNDNDTKESVNNSNTDRRKISTTEKNDHNSPTKESYTDSKKKTGVESIRRTDENNDINESSFSKGINSAISPNDPITGSSTSNDSKTPKLDYKDRAIVFPTGPANHINKIDKSEKESRKFESEDINDKKIIEESVKETVEENINERNESIDLNDKADDINPPEHELITNVKPDKMDIDKHDKINTEDNETSGDISAVLQSDRYNNKDNNIDTRSQTISPIKSKDTELRTKENTITDTEVKYKKRSFDKITDNTGLETTSTNLKQTNDKVETEKSPGKKKIKLENKTDNFDEVSDQDVIDKENLKRLENDKRLKNPKSEFVISQTLPRAARALGLYSEDGLETTGIEYLKRKYNVASYPTTDLKDLLPGELPDADFSMPKPTNQIQYNTFLNFVDNFFKDLNDDDIKFLKEKNIIPKELQNNKVYDPDVTPFIIPKLGPLYTKTWIDEDNGTKVGNFSPVPLRDVTSVLPRKNGNDINDSVLDTEDISCGPLLTRLLSAVLRDERDDQINSTSISAPMANGFVKDEKFKKENDDNISISSSTGITGSNTLDNTSEITNHTIEPHEINIPTNNNGTLGGGTTSSLKNEPNWQINSVNLDYPTFEERLKRELKYVGIYMNLPRDINSNTSGNNPSGSDTTNGANTSGNNGDPDWLYGREDDEISAELRQLQSSLKQVTYRNTKRKQILLPLLERQLAWQEYSSILNDLDKQVDQAYIKRIRVPKKKKKHGNSSHGSHHGTGVANNTTTASQLAQQKAADSSLKSLLDKRQRWINKIGPLFDSPHIMKRIPLQSVFKDMEPDEEDEETDVFEHEAVGKDEELTQN